VHVAMLSCLDTTGDRIRLGDTSLIVEWSETHHGLWRRMCFGGGKTLRMDWSLAPGVLPLMGLWTSRVKCGVNGSSARNCENGYWDYRFRQPRLGRIGEVICRTWQLADERPAGALAKIAAAMTISRAALQQIHNQWHEPMALATWVR